MSEVTGEEAASWEHPAADHVTAEPVSLSPGIRLWLLFAYGLSGFVVLFCVLAPESWFVWNWLQFK